MLKRCCQIAGFLLMIGAFVPAIGQGFQPSFEPGYRPDPSTDEGGFWYQVDKYEKKVKESPELINDPELNAYLKEIACKITPDYCEHIRIYVIRSPHFNASMYPNGMMHIWTGVLLRAKSEAELATVIAHEIAHFLRAHQIQQWRKLKKSTSVSVFFDVFLTMGFATLGVMNNAMSFSREQESEADFYGLELMVQAGYTPHAAPSLWEYIYQETENDKTKQKQGAFFATHPKTEDRLSMLKEKVASIESVQAAQQSLANYIEKVRPHYFNLMKGHVDLRDVGRTELMLKRHESLGYAAGKVEFFRAEMHKLRAEDGDFEKAIQHYKNAINSESPPPQAYRELGYLLTKQRHPDAKHYLQTYIDIVPDASDKKMVEFYLKSL